MDAFWLSYTKTQSSNEKLNNMFCTECNVIYVICGLFPGNAYYSLSSKRQNEGSHRPSVLALPTNKITVSCLCNRLPGARVV